MSDGIDSRSSYQRGWARVVSVLPRRDWLVVGWVLAIKLLLFVFAVKSYQILQNQRVIGIHGWFEIWNRWDSLHYQRLAEFGYRATDPAAVSFYPLFPWCVRLFAIFVGDYLISALLVSGLACIAAVLILRRLVELDYPGRVSERAVWFFLIFPTSYFLHIGYTESLFLALALGSLFVARNDRWGLASLLGAFCWMTRPTGVVIIPTLIMEALHRYSVTRRWNWRWLWIVIVPAGFGTYLWINWHVTGDPFTFLEMRRKIFVMSFDRPWVSIYEAIGNLRREPTLAEMVGAQELYFIGLGLICTILSWIKLRPLYGMWMTTSWLLFTSVSFLQSVPRYTMQLFPIFILFALVAANRFWYAVITVWSLLFLALFTSLFVRGWWAF